MRTIMIYATMGLCFVAGLAAADLRHQGLHVTIQDCITGLKRVLPPGETQ